MSLCSGWKNRDDGDEQPHQKMVDEVKDEVKFYSIRTSHFRISLCGLLLRNYSGGAGFQRQYSHRATGECFQGVLQRFCICDFIFINDYAALDFWFDAGAGLSAISDQLTG
jgi:hypothetical protein